MKFIGCISPPHGARGGCRVLKHRRERLIAQRHIPRRKQVGRAGDESYSWIAGRGAATLGAIIRSGCVAKKLGNDRKRISNGCATTLVGAYRCLLRGSGADARCVGSTGPGLASGTLLHAQATRCDCRMRTDRGRARSFCRRFARFRLRRSHRRRNPLGQRRRTSLRWCLVVEGASGTDYGFQTSMPRQALTHVPDGTLYAAVKNPETGR